MQKWMTSFEIWPSSPRLDSMASQFVKKTWLLGILSRGSVKLTSVRLRISCSFVLQMTLMLLTQIEKRFKDVRFQEDIGRHTFRAITEQSMPFGALDSTDLWQQLVVFGSNHAGALSILTHLLETAPSISSGQEMQYSESMWMDGQESSIGQ